MHCAEDRSGQSVFPEKLVGLAVIAVISFVMGCGTESTTSGHQTYLYKAANGQEILTTLPCGNTSDPCNQRYSTVTITNDPRDEEFWQFETRVQVRALIGISYGRRPQDINVIGPREQCEAVREKIKNDPTEPCKGPFYFRRSE